MGSCQHSLLLELSFEHHGHQHLEKPLLYAAHLALADVFGVVEMNVVDLFFFFLYSNIMRSNS